MVGFGFMDNMVMIQAGQYIDSTIGVQLGLATLTAAACGKYSKVEERIAIHVLNIEHRQK
jgi:hypothetical protein